MLAAVGALLYLGTNDREAKPKSKQQATPPLEVPSKVQPQREVHGK